MADSAIQQGAGQSQGQGETTPAQGGSTPQPSNGNSGAGASWFDGLPEGLRGEPSLQAFKGKDITAVAESYVNAQKLVGGSIRLPKPDAPAEERAKLLDDLYGKLGRPGKPEEYKYERPGYEEMGLSWNQAEEQNFLQTAHKIGLNGQQVQELLKWQADSAVRTAPNHTEMYEKCMETLTKGDNENPGWGSTTPRYLGTAKRVVDTMFSKDMLTKLDNAGLSNDPDFIRGLYRIGKELIEDGVISGEVEKSPDGQDALQVELDKMMKDPKSPYFDRNHPDHDKMVERALEIRRFLFS